MDPRAQVLAYLRGHHVMTVATAGPDGPAAAAVFYASCGLDLCFLSAPHSLHGRNIAIDPRVAITIQGDCTAWSDIKGIQMLGTARLLDGEEAGDARRLYAARFPEIPVSGSATGTMARALLRIRWYRVTTTWLRFIDNARGFGHRDEWSREEFVASPVAPP